MDMIKPFDKPYVMLAAFAFRTAQRSFPLLLTGTTVQYPEHVFRGETFNPRKMIQDFLCNHSGHAIHECDDPEAHQRASRGDLGATNIIIQIDNNKLHATDFCSRSASHSILCAARLACYNRQLLSTDGKEYEGTRTAASSIYGFSSALSAHLAHSHSYADAETRQTSAVEARKENQKKFIDRHDQVAHEMATLLIQTDLLHKDVTDLMQSPLWPSDDPPEWWSLEWLQTDG
jgi:hypothetical protein